MDMVPKWLKVALKFLSAIADTVSERVNTPDIGLAFMMIVSYRRL